MELFQSPAASRELRISQLITAGSPSCHLWRPSNKIKAKQCLPLIKLSLPSRADSSSQCCGFMAGVAEGAGSHPQCQAVTCQRLLRGCWPVPKQPLECLAHPALRCFCCSGSRAPAVPDPGFSLQSMVGS